VFFASSDEESLVLDAHATAGGENRYAIWDDGSVHAVTKRAAVRAHPVHNCTALRTRTKLR
jgi:hypothetical protein